MNKDKTNQNPMDANTKKILKVIFVTLFLDLVGFSIIFPLFPSLLDHYLLKNPNDPVLVFILDAIKWFSHVGGAPETVSPIVLFGGILAALYSLLQFFFAPIWGGMSDRVGRKPILLISIGGIGLSYVLWFFSGSFTLLVLARFIGGLMAGNISTATAVVSDITTEQNRSKGMAIIGIAFGIGFIFGPAIGGIASTINLTKYFPNLVPLGVNPFSMPALIAAVFSLVNFLMVWKNFPETLPPEKRGESARNRTSNILKLFQPLPEKNVNLTNLAYFVFLLAFSGMEFTLTFLAAERLGYTSMMNAYMFIFIGLTLAFVQGGFVRRKAHQIGEKRLTLMGLILLIPSLLVIGNAYSTATLYLGLFLTATSSAMIIPCLTSLVSIFSPKEIQGKSIGIFRSLGALARVLGPIIACVAYWKYGAAQPYFLSSALTVISILFVLKLSSNKVDPQTVADL